MLNQAEPHADLTKCKEELPETTTKLIDMLMNLVMEPTIKEIPKELEDMEQVQLIHDHIARMRTIYWAFSRGDFDVPVDLKGAIGGAAKSLQANLRHLSWQVQMVANGDFTQRVDFMGEFSSAFNTMVVQFEQTLNNLKQQEELLKGITNDLHKEIAVRSKAEDSLRKSEERYRSLSRMDPLTGMYNRRYFFDIASAELDRMIRNNNGVCTIAMLDIDHFKNFNDSYGHLNGDACLKQIAKILSDKVRRFDVVARYGGEEFILLLPQTKQQSGFTVVDRIREEVENASIETVDYGTLKVTISIGIATFIPEEDDSEIKDTDELLQKIISNADTALYSAKKLGRNRVYVYEPDINTLIRE